MYKKSLDADLPNDGGGGVRIREGLAPAARVFKLFIIDSGANNPNEDDDKEDKLRCDVHT